MEIETDCTLTHSGPVFVDLLPGLTGAGSGIQGDFCCSPTAVFSAAVNEANRLVRNKKLDEALTIYSQLRLDQPEHALLNLNTGIAEFENGQFSAAKDSFTIASFSEDSKIAAKARYNLGNCFYAQALQSQSSDQNSPPDMASAIESLQTAIQHYRRALRIQRDLPNARHNIELAVRLIDRLRQQQAA